MMVRFFLGLLVGLFGALALLVIDADTLRKLQRQSFMAGHRAGYNAGLEVAANCCEHTNTYITNGSMLAVALRLKKIEGVTE